jgi:hypothetical protein
VRLLYKVVSVFAHGQTDGEPWLEPALIIDRRLEIAKAVAA